MSKNMESKPATPSVIARLMGLDELQSQQFVNKQKKQKRVLSENYLRKVASIGAWEKKWSFDRRSSFRLSNEEQREFKDAFEGIGSLKRDKGSDSGKGCYKNRIEKSRYLITEHYYDQEGLSFHLQSGNVEFLESYAFECEKHKKIGSPTDQVIDSQRKIVILKPKPGEAETDKKDKGFLGRGKGISHAQVKERQNLPDGVKSIACRSIRSSETKKEISRKARDNISDEPPRLGFSGSYGLTNEPEFMMVSSRNNSDVENRYKPSYVAQEAKQQISERWRMTTEFRENGVAIRDRGRNRTLGEMLALPDHAKRENVLGPSGISSRDGWKNGGVRDLIKSQPQVYSTSFGSPYMTMRPVFPWSRRMSIKQVSSGKNCPKQRNPGSNYKQSQSSPDLESEKSAEQGTVQEMSAEDCVVPETSVFSAASLSIVSEQVESTGCTTSEKDCDSSVCVPDAWSQQENVSTKISAECSIDPDFLVNLETINQPSPVSVLEAPFAEENSLSSKCFPSITASLNDVKRQLEFIKSESIEEYSEGSEGPGIVVSSDDENDAGEESLKDCGVNEYSKKLFALAESKDFSYLVDVLTEAGFHSINSDILSNRWHTPETPISLSVFETLEKKYGEQISWKRSERRLLFDRINSGLTKILQPCLGDTTWKQPVARRLSYSRDSKVIEKELYMLLVSQENEAKNSSEKVLGKDDGWLSLGYEIEEIGREIENSLIDELAAEIVSL